MLKKTSGNITILVSFVLVLILVSLAFVTDFGVIYAEKAKLIKAMDAAILAGGQALPENISEARSVMETYLIDNGVGLDQVTIWIADDGMSASITGTKDVEHVFAKVIGMTTTEVNGISKIQLGALVSVQGGIRPFGVEAFDFSYGDQVVLKSGAGDGYSGNYGALALGGTGGSVLLDNALYGYTGEIAIGDWVSTEPGNIVSLLKYMKDYINTIPETFDNYSMGSDRIWTLPLIRSLEVEGRDEVEVVGFGQFFVEDIGKVSGKATFTGRFIQYVSPGDIDFDRVSTGALGMKLVE